MTKSNEQALREATTSVVKALGGDTKSLSERSFAIEIARKRPAPPLSALNPDDPRCVDPESGKLIAAALESYTATNDISIPEIAAAIGIGKENLYGYRRGFQVPTDVTREALEDFLGLARGKLKSSGTQRRNSAVVPDTQVTRKVIGDELVITTVVRIKLSDLA